MATVPDAVVVGAGPNGLTAAAVLAAAGLEVLVVEANDRAGGGAATAELTLPGFRHDVCSAVHPMGAALWHEVEATVFLVTHSLAEAVYLGDRVWIMAAAPGRIAKVFDDIIPPTRDADPVTVQESSAFKQVVAEVGRAFTEVERAARQAVKEPSGG